MGGSWICPECFQQVPDDIRWDDYWSPCDCPPRVSLDPRILENAPFSLTGDARIIVAATVGSQSHGTYIPKDDGGIDDVDVLGAILPPVDRMIGLDGFDHWVQMIDELDLTFFSLKKMVSLWLKSNPNVLGLLWLRDEDYLIRSDKFNRFVEMRDAFVCQQVADAFGGYAFSQIQRIHKNRHEGYMGAKRKELVEKHGYDVKNAAHAIRLLRMACEFMHFGELFVHRTHDADELRAIKRGEWTLEQVQSEAARLFNVLEGWKHITKLPAKPDRERANALLVDITQKWIADSWN